MTSPAQLHQLAAQTRLASQVAERRLEQTRQLVKASQQCYAQSRQAMTDPHRKALSASPHDSMQLCASRVAPRGQVRQPSEGASVASDASLLDGAWPVVGAR